MIAIIIDGIIWYILSQMFLLAIPLAAILVGNFNPEIDKILYSVRNKIFIVKRVRLPSTLLFSNGCVAQPLESSC